MPPSEQLIDLENGLHLAGLPAEEAERYRRELSALGYTVRLHAHYTVEGAPMQVLAVYADAIPYRFYAHKHIEEDVYPPDFEPTWDTHHDPELEG